MTKAADIAKALRGQNDLYSALRAACAGLTEAEAETLLPAILTLCDAEIATRLRSVDQGLLRAVMRAGAGFAATKNARAVIDHLRDSTVAPLFQPDISAAQTLALLTNGEHPDMPPFSDPAFDVWFAAKGVTYGLGSYGENRSVYQTPQFADPASPERRTRHLGIDVFAPAGTPVHAPLPGRVAVVSYNADPLDYGNTLILEHNAGAAPFWTLYGHLAGTLPDLCRVGNDVVPGQIIAHLGDWPENGGWAAHLHFQVMTDMLEQRGGNFFGVGHVGLWDIWQQICPDPNLVMRLEKERFCVYAQEMLVGAITRADQFPVQ